MTPPRHKSAAAPTAANGARADGGPGRLAVEDQRRRAGRIVNVSSELDLIGCPTRAARCASKGGVIALTKAVAKEVAPLGLPVNSVAPGPTETNMLKLDAIEFNDETRVQTRLRRFGQPDEIAAAIEFLAGPAGSYLVGDLATRVWGPRSATCSY